MESPYACFDVCMVVLMLMKQNREYTARQISDLAAKIEQVESSLSQGTARGTFQLGVAGGSVGGGDKKKSGGGGERVESGG